MRLPAYRRRPFVEGAQRILAAATAKVADYLTATRAETTEWLTLSWRLNHMSLAEDARFDGIHCLLTNDTAPDASPHRLDHDYTGQPKVEGRLRVVDSLPIQVRPVWLHEPKRGVSP